MTKTLKKEIGKVRKDEWGKRTNDLIGTISVGERVEVSFEDTKMIVTGKNCLTGPDFGKPISIKCRAAKYAFYFGGKVPSMTTMQKWEYEGGYCKTVTGLKTEPDGHGHDGSPSWMLALGLI
jgi:hypothetical protein